MTRVLFALYCVHVVSFLASGRSASAAKWVGWWEVRANDAVHEDPGTNHFKAPIYRCRGVLEFALVRRNVTKHSPLKQVRADVDIDSATATEMVPR